MLKHIQMKKIIFIFAALTITFVAVHLYSCEDDPKETCKQDEFCDAKMVTTCCTDNDCVYKYNGVEYTESEEDDLAEILSCTVPSAGLKSGNLEDETAEIKARLRALMAKTRAQALK